MYRHIVNLRPLKDGFGMKRNQIFYLTTLVVLFCAYSNCYLFGQSSNDSIAVIAKVKLYGGKKFFGTILKDDGREVLIQTIDRGQVYLSKTEIRKIETLSEDQKNRALGEFQKNTPFANHYVFGTSALSNKRGTHQVAFHLYGSSVKFALSDRLTVGVSASWVVAPIAASVAYSIPLKEKINISIGSSLMSSSYLGWNSFFEGHGYGGMHYLNLTLGDRLKNLTVESAFGWINDGFSQRSIYDVGVRKIRPASIFGFAGICPLSPSISMVCDSKIAFSEQKNYAVFPANGITQNEDVTIYSSGTRISGVFQMGLRFHQSEKFAFQCTLGPFAEYSTNGFDYYQPSIKNFFLPVGTTSFYLAF